MDYSEIYSKIQNIGEENWVVNDGGKIKLVSIPLYIDYKSRSTLIFRRIIFIIMFVLITIISIWIIGILYNQVMEIAQNLIPAQ